jgi:hypothetical protein
MKKDLMVTRERKWDEAKLHMLFDSTIVQHITSVPLFSFSDEDKLNWKYDRSGMYIVRSGYHVMRNIKGDDKFAVEGDWDSLWRTKVPPKVRNLIWRICRGCLPT